MPTREAWFTYFDVLERAHREADARKAAMLAGSAPPREIRDPRRAAVKL